MPVNVIDTIKPKNGGSFPVVEAVDVSVDSLNLEQALDLKADATDLDEVGSRMNLKANKSEVNAVTTSLQNQINEIVAPVTQDAEVQNARVGADGESYDTLKERLDSENEKIDEKVNKYFGEAEDLTDLLENGAIATNVSPVTLTPASATIGTDYYYAIVSCTEGENFRLVGVGSAAYRWWAFIDSSNNIITRADSMSDWETSHDVTITAPEGAAKLVANFRTVYVAAKLYKIGNGVFYEVISDVDGKIGGIDSKMDMLIEEAKLMFKDGTITSGYYVKASTGELTESSGWNASDYIDVRDSRYIYVKGVQQSAYYNSEKEYIGNFGNISENVTTETRFDIPSGCAFIRFSLSNAQLPTAYYKTENSGYTYAFDVNKVIRIGAGREFTTLRAGIAEAVKYRSSKVYVDAGTYDLTSEFAAEITADRTSQYGIFLDNDVHIIFSSGAKVTAIYTGSSTNVETYFAPFFSINGDFTLENLDIESKNTRYCVHDEAGGSSGSYNHRYINCKMKHDNSTSGISGGGYLQCIGGGLGKNGYIDIVGCTFWTKRGESSTVPAVSYHNNSAASSKSNINIRDCYFADNSTVRVTYYGTSTLVSSAIVCNCSLGAAPYIQHEAGSTGPENMELVTYLNEIRE